MIFEMHQFMSEMKGEKMVGMSTPAKEMQKVESSKESQAEIKLKRLTDKLHDVHTKISAYKMSCQGDKPDKRHYKQYGQLLELLEAAFVELRQPGKPALPQITLRKDPSQPLLVKQRSKP